ncbi:MAG: hypothetical protein HYX90_07395, partial [Chloroflexi bacterium]|nr:hypothetical protein [Chloroflexota bacterium]
ELGQTERAMSVVSIGPAGENLVKFAGVFVDKGHVASHNGVGAVMGSKKLKAIAVARGQGRPALADKKGVSRTAEEFHQIITTDPATALTFKWGTLTTLERSGTAKDGVLPVKNYSTSIFEIEPEKLEKFGGPYIRSHFDPKPCPCWACRMHHCHILTIPDGPYKGLVTEEPEYEQFAAFGPAIGQTDCATAMMLSNEVDRLGMDANEAGWVIGLVMECYAKGVLSKSQCDGLEMDWGNAEAARELMRKTAKREGIGNMLADGVMRAARAIGGEAPNFAVHTMKGNTPRGHDHRSRWPMLMDTCVSQMGTDEGYNIARPEDVGISVKPSLKPNWSAEDAVQWNGQCKGAIQFEDCLGVCRFNTRTEIKLLAQGVSAATGWDFSPREAMDVGRRVVNMLRLFNLRHGHTAALDAPSPRYGSIAVNGPAEGKNVMATWEDMRRRYYQLMGWDPVSGVPLPETLQHLGIE